MNTLLVTARAVHFGSVMLLFGEFMFVLFVARPPWRADDRASLDEDQRVNGHMSGVAFWSLLLSLVSSAAWLAAEAASMSGLPLQRAIAPDTLGLVLGRTVFGRLWTLRFVLVIAVGLLLLAINRSRDRKHRFRLELGALMVAAVYLGSLAWAGHAAAGQGSERWVQIISDVVHLLAAGAWLGALPGLVFLLGSARTTDRTAQAVRRFSIVGLVSVGALILSGFVNSWFLVGSVPALLGTGYGRLLLAKLTLVVFMVSLAAVNRLRLTPRLHGQNPDARLLLRRNAILETVAGLGVVAVVGALGVSVPGAHQPALWPFQHTLSWELAENSAATRWMLAAAGVLACIAAGVALRGVRSRRPQLWVTAIVGIVAAVAAGAWLLAVPAYPTTYVHSPVRYTTTAIARGSARYAENCASCHGPGGHGDGPAAPSLPVKPANLVKHAAHHPPGDLFWWIGHGMPETPMPAFAAKLSDEAIWDLIQFLRALSDAEEAKSICGHVEPRRPIVAPDFTFDSPGHAQESLNAQRGKRFPLLVLYTFPQSLPRMKALLADEQELADAGVRLIALPTSTLAAADMQTMKDDASVFRIASPDVVTTYSMFARRDADSHGVAPIHAEFLIDGQGYLRARWPCTAATTERTAEIFREIELLKHERARPPAQEGHMH